MLARRVETISTIGRVKPTADFAPMSCSALDDLLDEILGDQKFRNNVPSHKPQEPTSATHQQHNGQPICSAVQQNNGCTPRTTAASSTGCELSRAAHNGSEDDTRATVRNPAVDVTNTQKTSGGNNTGVCPVVGSSFENGAETQTGSRGRTPSLPVSYSPVNRYRRLQSVPCNDYYGGGHNVGSQSFYFDRADQFVRGLGSEEPATWLDRQKMKLQSRNENRWWSNQSDQQKRLVEELKAAQTMLGGVQRRGEEEQTTRRDVPDDENGAKNSNSMHRSQTLGNHRQPRATGPSMSDQLQGLDLLQPCVNDAATESDTASSSCKSERNYYISGVELPPFTTHQTRYVFSVSSPHSSSHLTSSDGIQKVQTDQRVSGRPGPPTPKRVSSRDAMSHSSVHDWKLEQWEQESYTSLSSKSDVPETSVPADKRINGSVETRQQTFHSSSSPGCVDQSGIYDVLDVSRTHFHGTNGPAVSYSGRPGCVDSTSMNTNAGSTIANSSFDAMLNGSSTTSGTSSLSINSNSHSAFEPLQQQSSADGQASYSAAFSASSTDPSSEQDPGGRPVPGSMVVVTSHPATDMHHSVSDFTLEGRNSFSRNAQNSTENALVKPPQATPGYHSRLPPPSSSSSFPSDFPFPAAVSASSPKPNVSAPGTTMALEKSPSLKKREESHGQVMISAGTRQLPVPAEQLPPGSDGTEVISLQLIGPGMQKLEPEGDLPAVRPVTPKYPQPGVVAGASNSLISRPKSLGNQRHFSSEENSNSGPAVHQKFDPGARRATVYDHTLVAVDPSKEQNSNSCNNSEPRTELTDALNGEDQMKQRMKHRRHTTSSGHELLLRPTDRTRRPGGSEGAPSAESAFRRTERLLSADFTAQGGPGAGGSLLLDRRGSASPSAGDRPTGRRGSTALAAEGREHNEGRTDRVDGGMNDVFTTKSGSERRNSKAHGKREREREVNLAMLDNAVAGLRASASSPVDGSSSSNTVVQSPPPGKATPGLPLARDPLSPRASIHTLSNGAVTSSSSNNSTDTTIRTNHAPRFVRDSSRYWHKPNISRDEAIACLKDKAPGTFVIRNSNSFPGAFGLALKVAHLPPNVQSRGGDPKAELVRHFLIEPTSKGVKLKGCNSEPVFGSLAALVYQHSMTPLSLPCKLIIPDPSSARKRDETAAKSDVTTSEALLLGATCNVLYINSVDMESLTGNEAIDKAVSATVAMTPTPLTTVVQLKVSSHGVTLTDVNRKLFFRRHYPVDTVTFAGIDPEMRSWVWTNDETKSAHKSNVFGFVARKQGSPMDNACHVFAELDRDQPGDAIVDFIMKVMLGQG